MPSKKDQNIVQILQDLQSGKLDPRIKGEDLLKQYPICEHYCDTKKDEKNFETWCLLSKDLLDPYPTNNRITYIRYPIVTDKPNSKQSKRPLLNSRKDNDRTLFKKSSTGCKRNGRLVRQPTRRQPYGIPKHGSTRKASQPYHTSAEL